jgi:hypothetical protein
LEFAVPRFVWSFVLLICVLPSWLQAEELSYYFPADGEYDSAIPSPEQFLGFEIGDRHLQHHELSAYVQSLAKSKRVKLIEYGKTYGNRPLYVLAITSPKNLKQLDRIREAQQKLSNPESSDDVDTTKQPAIIWMGYGVHGNEPSASNAAVLVAYHLAASRSESVTQSLDQTVVLLDPCLNPDGFDRFANWANAYRGNVANADPQHREHNELSPTGRTNYYWFDLNRDWMPARQPESQGRLALYQEWKPNVVLDYHEMGASSTYFFQPGVPSRSNPLAPKSNLALTREFAKFHAKALDRIGSLYFTEERFDDYYIGKGSTYPDLRGAVGILFEQASARGQKQETTNGVLEFSFAIRNQVTTSLSSLEATVAHRETLHEHMRTFYKDSVSLARNASTQAFVFSAGADVARADEFIRLMTMHGIEVRSLAKDITIGGRSFKKGRSYVIAAEQPEYRLLLAMTEARKVFEDKVFYDISAWSVPMAFGLHWAEWKEPLSSDMTGDAVESVDRPSRSVRWSDDDYAYLVPWNSMHAPRTLGRLHDAGIIVKAAKSPFTVPMRKGTQAFTAGTMVIPLGIQEDKVDLIRESLECAMESDGVAVSVAKTGLTVDGIDLGSSSIERLVKPKVMLVVGTSTSDYDAGEVWFHFDRKLGMPLTLVDALNFSSTSLDRYTHIILVGGTYSQISSTGVDRLATWLQRGGTLVATGTSGRWLDSKKIVSLNIRKPSSESKPRERISFSEAANQSALQSIEGAILEAEADMTHPLCFGLPSNRIPVFRAHTLFVEPSTNPFSTPLVYSQRNTLLSGYVSDENIKLASGSAAMLVKSEGSGRVIVIPDNPIFRGYWYGTQRLLENAVFFGSLADEPRETE